MLRRQILATVAATFSAYLAGCNDLGKNSGPEADGNTSRLSDERGTWPRNAYAPSISIEALATQYAGQLEVSVRVEDDNGLEEVVITLNGKEVRREPLPGSQQDTYQTVIDAADSDAVHPGELNRVQAAVSDTAGNSTEETEEQYVREFEPLEQQDIEVGGCYMPFFAFDNRWNDCAVGTPEIGAYYMNDEEALNRHADLMQGFGITRWQIDFVNVGHVETFLSTRANTLATNVPLEINYTISNSVEWRDEGATIGENIDSSLQKIRDEFFAYENYASRDGRPVVKFWSISTVTWDGNEIGTKLKEYVLENHGSFAEFGRYLREKLTKNGTNPYIIGGFRSTGQGYYEYDDPAWLEDRFDLAKTFDAVSNWTGDNPSNQTVSQQEHLEFQEENFAGYQELANDYGIEFIPVVHPGFDDRDNECWGENRYIPPDADHLEAMFELANEYRTTDRIDVATFNDWGEGHQVEPGTYDGESYGTRRLEVVKEFAQRDA